jgi:hypothetical protein
MEIDHAFAESRRGTGREEVLIAIGLIARVLIVALRPHRLP